jgi:plastocyanin
VNRTGRRIVEQVMRRILRLAFAAAAVTAVVAACSSDPDSGTAAPAGTSSAPTSSAPSPSGPAPSTGTSSAATSSAATSSAGAGSAATASITIKDFRYGDPVTVAPGATITVTNEDAAGHDVVSDDGKFKTPSLGQGEKSTFTAPTEPGTYKFSCSLHPRSMSGIGTLIVQG